MFKNETVEGKVLSYIGSHVFCPDSEDVPQASSISRRDSEDVSLTSSSLCLDSEDL